MTTTRARAILALVAALGVFLAISRRAEADLVAWWNLADGAGTTALDTSPSPIGGGANDGTLSNFVDPSLNWNVGLSGATDGVTMSHGLKFDGGANGSSSSSVDLDAHVGDLNSLSAGTITAWFRSEIGATPDDHSIIGFGRPDNLSYFRVHLENLNSNAPEYRVTERNVDTVGGTDITTEMAAPYVDDGNWHHVAFTNDGTTGTLYVDGYRAASMAMPFVDFTSFAEAAIGMTPRLGSELWYFNGTLGDVRIYNEVLSGDPSVQGAHVLVGSQLDYVARPAHYGDGMALNQATAELTVDRDTGAITIQNTGVNLTKVVGYSIKSAAETLKPAQWTSIADNYDAGNPGPTQVDPDNQWTKLTNASSRSDLSESEFQGLGGANNGADFLNGKTTSLGNAWIKYFVEDLQMQVLFDDGSVGTLGVHFTGNGGVPFEFGDLNFDGVLNADDFYDVFVPHFEADTSSLISPAEKYQVGDLDGNGVVELEDFVMLNNAYLAANPGALPLSLPVPEPSTWVLVAIAALLGGTVSRRRVRLPLRAAALLAAGLACLCGGTTARAAVVAHWTFDEAPGAVTLVDSVSGLDGTAASSNGIAPLPQSGVTGQIGNAWQFAGPASTSGGYIDLTPHLASFSNLTTGTISAWFTTNDASAANALISAYNSAVGSTEGRLFVETTGVLTWDVRDEGGNPTGEAGNLVAGNVLGGQWHHVAVTFDGNSNASLYLDGTLAQTAQEPFWGQISTLNGIAIGRNVDLQTAATGGQWFWEGNIDDMQIYDNELPPAAINAIHAAGLLGQSLEITPTTPFTLGLQVDSGTGMIQLRNDTVFSIDLDAYRILSSGGSLSGAGWNSLEDQDYEGQGPTSGWTELADGVANGGTQLAEAFFGGSSVLAPGTSIMLQNAYNASLDLQDLAFEYHLAGDDVVFQTGTVQYVTTGPMPDINMDGFVNIFDINLVSSNWNKMGAPGTVPGDANKDGVVDIFDINLISANWTGSTPVPEPSGLALLGLALALGAAVRLRKLVPVCLLSIAACWGTSASADVFPDRNYTLGDDSFETGEPGMTVGNSTGGVTYDSAGSIGIGDLQDLAVSGAPSYIDVTGRPFLVGGNIGAHFGGADALSGVRLNAPHEVWDSDDINANAPPSPFFPNNYQGILNRGFDVWVRPDVAKQGSGTRQDIVLDTAEHGLFITTTDTWGMQFDDVSIDTGVSVNYGQWTHAMQRTLLGRTGAVLYLDGVAAKVDMAAYDFSTSALLTVGSNLTQDGNFFQGDLDNLRLFLWGDNTNAAIGAQGQAGGDWGDLVLSEDNEWIAGKLAQLGVTDPADVDLDGSVGPADIDALKAGWLSERIVDGVHVGDWVSRQNGDLNYDGYTNLDDVWILHNALVTAGGVGVDFREFNAVPEPSTLALFALGCVIFLVRCRVLR
jgi:trimeric autotransporter adhesin